MNLFVIIGYVLTFSHIRALTFFKPEPIGPAPMRQHFNKWRIVFIYVL